ncbi:MAG: hypothetical protein EOO40_03070 [Deltaproteobacteria bacterium]|nr:MAG: hypothetical protein EOO40_03070 [Deltaproteobacteria bacterium]
MSASYVQILNAVEPDSSCKVATTNNLSSQGYYDPTVNYASGYQANFVIKNNLAKAADDPVAFSEIANVHNEVNDLRVEGFEGCWYQVDDTTFAYGKDSNGLLDCATLPGQSGWLPVVQTIAEGQDIQVASLNVLGLDHMRQVFGATFDPMQIPREGNIPEVNYGSTDPNLQYNYSANTASPADAATRSAAWGANYPLDREALVNLQVRARLKSQSGEIYYSNYVAYPITVCPGCLQNACGLLVPKVCARGPCASGAACLFNGTCADGTLCSNDVLLSGSAPNFEAPGVCLPAQGYSTVPVTCVLVGCNSTT